ncbi:DoxX family protein [Flavimarina sp. Hel_I_48]|uniref:DoxX family protein n=1 Tax=Flavimarina sp. Hel_I_48 TaxID=1392488 RepID=UPI0004DFA86E|nr:DoxX family protein [Flavimarina sp. Hel_I_48]
MTTLSTLAILIIAVSIIIVWVFRFDNIVKEFKQYGLPDIVRNMVGAAKIAISTLLVAGIWYDSPVVWPTLAMAFLMLCAQVAHIKVRNPFVKYLPSLALLVLSLYVAGVYSEVL